MIKKLKCMTSIFYHLINPHATDLTRTDVENYDIEELYEFADATGILERHKALLSQPFNESQVFRHQLFQHYCVDNHGVKN